MSPGYYLAVSASVGSVEGQFWFSTGFVFRDENVLTPDAYL